MTAPKLIVLDIMTQVKNYFTRLISGSLGQWISDYEFTKCEKIFMNLPIVVYILQYMTLH